MQFKRFCQNNELVSNVLLTFTTLMFNVWCRKKSFITQTNKDIFQKIVSETKKLWKNY